MWRMPAFSLFVFALLLGSGASARLRDGAERWTPSPALQTAAYFVPLLAITTLIGFPLTLYRSYFRERAYGILTQGFADWLLDQAKVFALNAVFGALVLMALYAVLRRTPGTWWIWGTAVLVGFMAVFAALGPVFVMPLFNKYSPVRDERSEEHPPDGPREGHPRRRRLRDGHLPAERPRHRLRGGGPRDHAHRHGRHRPAPLHAATRSA